VGILALLMFFFGLLFSVFAALWSYMVFLKKFKSVFCVFMVLKREQKDG